MSEERSASSASDAAIGKLQVLASYVEIFDSPSFTPGKWVASVQNANGVWSMPYVEISPELQAFVSMCYSDGWIIMGFDWMSWHGTEEATELFRDGGQFQRATVEQLARALTTVVRSDRFSEGSLMGAYESGLLRTISQRARDLLGPG